MSHDVPSVFGMSLDELLLTDDNIPVFMPIVCSYIKLFASTEGIFRKNGSITMIENLGFIFSLRDCAIPAGACIFDVTGFVTKWLRHLPSPLIPDEAVHHVAEDKNAYADMFRALPECNRRCLAMLSDVWNEVLRHEQENRMDASNLVSCVFLSLTGGRQSFSMEAMLGEAKKRTTEGGTDFLLNNM